MSTACGHRIALRKETKQEPGTAEPGNRLGCCLISFHFLWAILYVSRLYELPGSRISTAHFFWAIYRRRNKMLRSFTLPFAFLASLFSFVIIAALASVLPRPLSVVIIVRRKGASIYDVRSAEWGRGVKKCSTICGQVVKILRTEGMQRGHPYMMSAKFSGF